MSRSLKLILGLGAVVMIVALAVPAHAQCPTSQEFGATGNKNVSGRIFVSSAANGFPIDGNEAGSFWEKGNVGNNSGGPHFAGPETCGCTAGANWCIAGGGAGVDLSIRGFIASPTCLISACPDDKTLIWVVEDTNATDTDAGFITYQVDQQFTTVRPFDHSRTANPAPTALSTHVMERFPTVDVQSSSGPPPNTTLTNDYANITINFHGVATAADTPVDADAASGGSIVAYDICTFRGAADPGRARTAGPWVCDAADQIPYGNPPGPLSGTFDVPCPDPASDTFVAVGIEFTDGVKSFNVGTSTAVECDPDFVNPDDVKPRRQDRLGTRGRMTR